jgi:hypothetical protein
MWKTMALAAVLSGLPGQASELKLTNVRATCGILGPPRKVTELIPGCSIALTFDIEGITIDSNGKVSYSVELVVTDSSGKVIYKRGPQDLEAVAALGGSQIPGFTQLDIGLNQPPGDYTVKLTVVDRASKKSATLSRSVKVSPPTFGIVRLSATTDQEGHAPATVLASGQSLWVSTAVVGFARDPKTKQPHIRLDLRVLDADGKPTLDKPFTGEINKDVLESAVSIPAQFYMLLNRPGQFTVEVEASDLLAKKKYKLSFPITVQAVK